MKKSILALVILVAPFVALAADPVVVVNNVSSVTVDGVPSGSVVDVLANVNRPNIRARLLDALIAREAAIIAAEQSRADAAVTARQAADTAKSAETARVAAIVTALKGVSPTLLPAAVRAELQTAREKERAALLARKAEVEAQIATLP